MPPPRDLLSAQVRAEDLPDVARPPAPAPPPHDPPASAAAAGADPIGASARAVLAAGLLPLRLTEAALEGQAQAIDDWMARGAVPAPLIPGAVLMSAHSRLLAGMIHAAFGWTGDRTHDPG